MEYDDESEADELLWVKAGEPGEKPTIIRQIRSDNSSGSSRDNSGGSTSCSGRKLLVVDEGIFTCRNSNRNISAIDEMASTSSPDSRVIVVNVSEQVYPAVIDNHRIQRWKELHSPHGDKPIHISNSNNNTPTRNTAVINNHTNEKRNTNIGTMTNIQLSKMRCSPGIIRCASAEPKLSSPYIREKLIKSRDEGYTSLSEDYKDSDSESVRSKSLPSSWKATHLNKNGSEVSLHRYAQKIVNNNSCLNSLPNGNSSHNYSDVGNNSLQKKLRKKKFRHHLENTIETCTCFLCLRSAIYHAQDEDDSDSLVDHPCSCNEPSVKCGGRWAAISLMVCFFPLLLCYPPFKCCLSIHDKRVKRKKLKKEKLIRQKLKQVNCHKTVL